MDLVLKYNPLKTEKMCLMSYMRDLPVRDRTLLPQ